MNEDAFSLIEKWLNAKEFIVVGRSIARVDAIEKAIGKAPYTEDYLTKDALFVKQVLSPYPHAKIAGFNVKKALEVPGVRAVITYREIPGVNQVGYFIQDQPLLAEGKVRYVGEVVALVVADDYDAAFKGVENVEVSYEELPYVLDPLEAMNRRDILVHEEFGGNVFYRVRVIKGNVEEGFSRSDVIVENEYRTHHQDHMYLEPEAALAIPDMEGRITVICSTQNPHITRSITSKVLGLPSSYIKIVAPYVGGGFGGKDNEGPIVAAKAALAAYLTKKPAFLMYSREESVMIHPKKEATIIKYKSGASKDGRLQAIEVTMIHDSGAYANRTPGILWRSAIHASGPYEVPHAKVEGYGVYTNKVFEGSFRGFGNPSIQFAAETQMDLLAEKLGMDPIEFRLKNVLREGSYTITSQYLDHSVGIGDALRKVAEKAEWWDKRKRYGRDRGRFRRGIGVGVGWHGMGTQRNFPDWSNAYLKVEDDGSVTVYTGITEIGQGSPTTAFMQAVSEILGIPMEMIKVVFGTTDAPDTYATHASRGASIGGVGILIAAARIRERMAKLAAELLNAEPGDIVFAGGRVYVRDRPELQLSWKDLVKKAIAKGVELSATGYFLVPRGTFDETVGQGFGFDTYSYAATIAEVEVDTETGVIRVLRVWPALAAGRIINPQQVEGQIEGGLVQGMGHVLMEYLVFDDKGRILNPNMTDYSIPSIGDIPEIMEPIYVEDIFKYSMFGAKGVGELTTITIVPAIANAVSHALGVRVTSLPLTPENVLKLIEGRR